MSGERYVRWGLPTRLFREDGTGYEAVIDTTTNLTVAECSLPEQADLVCAALNAAGLLERAEEAVIWLRDYIGGYKAFQAIRGYPPPAEATEKARELDALQADLRAAREGGRDE